MERNLKILPRKNCYNGTRFRKTLNPVVLKAVSSFGVPVGVPQELEGRGRGRECFEKKRDKKLVKKNVDVHQILIIVLS